MPAGAHKGVIFLTDDDADLRDNFQEALEDSGYLVLPARSGTEALARMRGLSGTALAIVDLNMPGMDGWELISAMRADKDLASIPILVISSHGREPINGRTVSSESHSRSRSSYALFRSCFGWCTNQVTGEDTMATATQTDQLDFGSNAFAKHRHACAFFHSDDQEHRVLLPFVKEGFERGERAFHIIDPQHRTGYKDRLASSGVPVSDAEQTGQFELRDWHNAYLRDGHFDQNRMLSLIQEVLDDGKRRGYPLTRLVAHMEWALEDRPGVNDIVEYEARLNYVLPKYRDPVICTYDLAKFGGSVVVDIMRTHPVIILGNVIQENPFYVEPGAFLDEMKTRTIPKRPA